MSGYIGRRTQNGSVTVLVKSPTGGSPLEPHTETKDFGFEGQFDWGNRTGSAFQLAFALAYDQLKDSYAALGSVEDVHKRIVSKFTNDFWVLDVSRLRSVLKL